MHCLCFDNFRVEVLELMHGSMIMYASVGLNGKKHKGKLIPFFVLSRRSLSYYFQISGIIKHIFTTVVYGLVLCVSEEGTRIQSQLKDTAFLNIASSFSICFIQYFTCEIPM